MDATDAVTVDWLRDRFGKAWTVDAISPLLDTAFLRRVLELWPQLPKDSVLKPRLLLSLLTLPQPVPPALAEASSALVAAALSDESQDGEWGRVAAGLVAQYNPVAVGNGELIARALSILQLASAPIVDSILRTAELTNAHIGELMKGLSPSAAVGLGLARADSALLSSAAMAASSSTGNSNVLAAADNCNPVEIRDIPYELRLLPSSSSSSDPSGGKAGSSIAQLHDAGRHFNIAGTPGAIAAVEAAARRRIAMSKAAEAFLKLSRLSYVSDMHALYRHQVTSQLEVGAMTSEEAEAALAQALASLPPAPTESDLEGAQTDIRGAESDIIAYLTGGASSSSPTAGGGGGAGVGVGRSIGGFGGGRGVSQQAVPSSFSASSAALGKSFKRQREAPQAIDAHAEQIRTKVQKLDPSLLKKEQAAAAAVAASAAAAATEATAASAASTSAEASASPAFAPSPQVSSAAPTAAAAAEGASAAGAASSDAAAAAAAMASQREKLLRQLADAPLLSSAQRAVVTSFMELASSPDCSNIPLPQLPEGMVLGPGEEGRGSIMKVKVR